MVESSCLAAYVGCREGHAAGDTARPFALSVQLVRRLTVTGCLYPSALQAGRGEAIHVRRLAAYHHGNEDISATRSVSTHRQPRTKERCAELGRHRQSRKGSNLPEFPADDQQTEIEQGIGNENRERHSENIPVWTCHAEPVTHCDEENEPEHDSRPWRYALRRVLVESVLTTWIKNVCIDRYDQK